VLRYIYLRITGDGNGNYTHLGSLKKSIWGYPEYARYPPRESVWSFALTHREAFVKLWKHDLLSIVQKIKKRNIGVVLMTYHFPPGYIRITDYWDIVRETDIHLVRNDKTFGLLVKNKTIGNYLLADNWHPNKEGYSLIASNVYECIKKHNLVKLEQ